MLAPATAIVQELHKIAQGSVIMLIEVPAYSKYLARSKGDIVWNGHTYEKAWFEIDAVSENTDEHAPELTVQFTNIGGMVEQDILSSGNYARAVVSIHVVNVNCLAETDSIYSITLELLKVTVNRKVCTFKLGLSNPLLQAFPSWKFHDSICQYKPYMTDICDKIPTCGQTLNDCLAWGNDTNGNPYIERFGAQLGLLGAIQDDSGL